METLSKNPAFKCWKIPNYVEKQYKKLQREKRAILEIQNANKLRIFSNQFMSDIQGMLYYVKYSQKLCEYTCSQRNKKDDFPFLKENNDIDKKLELLRKDNGFRNYVYGINLKRCAFTDSELNSAFQLYLQMRYSSIFLNKANRKKIEKIDYYQEKELANNLNLDLKNKIIKDIIRSKVDKKELNKNRRTIERQKIANKVLMREELLKNGLCLEGVFDNNRSKYNFKEKIVLEHPRKYEDSMEKQLKKTVGVYIIETDADLWYIGETTQLSIRFKAHRRNISTNISIYNKQIDNVLHIDDIKNIYFIETKDFPEMRYVYEATLQIALMGELNKINELKGLLISEPVRDYIEELK